MCSTAKVAESQVSPSDHIVMMDDHIISPLQNITGGRDRFYNLDIHPTADVVLTSTYGKLEIWNMRTGVRLKTFENNRFKAYDTNQAYSKSSVTISKFSRDGKHIITNLGGGVSILDAITGSDITTIDDVADSQEVAFDLQSNILVYAQGRGSIRAVNIISRKEVFSKVYDEVGLPSEISISSKGDRIALFYRDFNESGKPAIQIIDVSTNQKLSTFALDGHKEKVNCWSMNTDFNILATGSDDRVVRLWDIQSGRSIATLRGHDSSVAYVAISGDGKILTSVDHGQVIRVWDIQSKSELYSRGYTGTSPYGLSMNQNGSTIALLTTSKSPIPSSVHLMDWKNDSERGVYTERGKAWIGIKNEDSKSPLVWDHAGRYIAKTGIVNSGNKIQSMLSIIDTKDWRHVMREVKSSNVISSFAFHPSEDRYVIGLGSGEYMPITGRIQDNEVVEGSGYMRRWEEDSVWPEKWTWAPGGKTLVGIPHTYYPTLTKKDVMIFDPISKSINWMGIDVFPGLKYSTEEVYVEFSPDGKLFAVYSGYGRPIEIWEYNTRKLKQRISTGYGERPDSRRINGVVWTNDSKMILAALERKVVLGSLSQSVRGWYVDTGKEINGELPELGGDCSSISIHPSGNYIAVADGTSFIHLWTLSEGSLKDRGFFLAERNIDEVAFRPDGKILAASGDGAILFWNCTPETYGSLNYTLSP